MKFTCSSCCTICQISLHGFRYDTIQHIYWTSLHVCLNMPIVERDITRDIRTLEWRYQVRSWGTQHSWHTRPPPPQLAMVWDYLWVHTPFLPAKYPENVTFKYARTEIFQCGRTQPCWNVNHNWFVTAYNRRMKSWWERRFRKEEEWYGSGLFKVHPRICLETVM